MCVVRGVSNRSARVIAAYHVSLIEFIIAVIAIVIVVIEHISSL